MLFDDILRAIGEFGRYQRLIYLLLCIPSLILGGMSITLIVMHEVPQYRCSIPGFIDSDFSAQDHLQQLLLNLSVPFEDDSYTDREQCSIYNVILVQEDQEIVSVKDICRTPGPIHAVNMSASLSVYSCDPDSETNDTLLAEPLWQWHNLTDPKQWPSVPSMVNVTRRACDRWTFDRSQIPDSAGMDFAMTCEDNVLRSTAMMVFGVGGIVGTFIFGLAGDMVGRRPGIILTSLVLCGSAAGRYFSQNTLVFMIFGFLQGFGASGLFMNCFVISMELVGPSKRTFVGIVVNIFYASGSFLVIMEAYILASWRNMILVSHFPYLLFIGYYWIVPESPRWLISKNKTAQAETILKKVASSNKTDFPDDAIDDKTLSSSSGGNVVELFTSRVLAIRSLIIFLNWFAVSCVYFGLGLFVPYLSGNVYANLAISSSCEMLAYFLCLVTMERLGRRVLYCASMLLGGLACIVTIFPTLYGNQDGDQTIITVLCMVGKLGASSAFAIIWVYTAELFPTIVRTSGVGTSSTIARIGSLASPYIADLGVLIGGDLEKILPLIVFGSLSLVSGVAALTLPETLHKRLPDTIEDAKNFGRKSVSAVETQMNGMSKYAKPTRTESDKM